MRKWIRHLAVAFGMPVLVTGFGAKASDCANLAALVDQARGNFAQGLPATADAPGSGPEATCGVSLQLDGIRVYRCHWKFSYRAAGASEAFEAKDQMLQSCTRSATRAPEDQQVNHPDSYDLRIYQSDGVKVSTSLKDKAALQETYVFLAIHGVKPN